MSLLVTLVSLGFLTILTLIIPLVSGFLISVVVILFIGILSLLLTFCLEVSICSSRYLTIYILYEILFVWSGLAGFYDVDLLDKPGFAWFGLVGFLLDKPGFAWFGLVGFLLDKFVYSSFAGVILIDNFSYLRKISCRNLFVC